MTDLSRSSNQPSRRDFMKASALGAAGVAMANLNMARFAHAAGSDTLKVALVGCGGRGTGAAINALNAKQNAKLVVMADAFADSLENSLNQIRKECGDRVDVADDHKFTGLDAYQKAVNSDVDVVLLCTPPGFRPAQYEAAVKAGKNVFMEKPLACDVPGVRRIKAANEEAKKKGLAVAVGHHLRHETKYRELIPRIHDGSIGDLSFLRVYFNTGTIWTRPRLPDQTEMQYQVRNWYHFNWLSGDHIVEQHVHDLDIGCWMAQAHPVEAQGMGGRQVAISKDTGEIFDHHSVEYTFANGLKMFSNCRQISGCWESFSQHAHGSKGQVSLQGYAEGKLMIPGQKTEKFEHGPDGHQVEMDDLFAAIKAGTPYNEVDWAVDSTMTAILGRMASYSGKIVTWDDAMKSELDLTPKNLAWDGETLVKPGPEGIYACALPGTTIPW